MNASLHPEPASDASESPLECLRSALSDIEAPAGMQSFVGLPLMQYAFFPGASGLWGGEGARFPVGGVLVLGSNFGAAEKHLNEDGKLLRQDERAGRTWAPLVDALRNAGIVAEDCFFTNAWPLLHRDGTSSNCSGQVHRWLRDEGLMVSCLRFFDLTLATMRPRLIVALGVGPAAFCAGYWPQVLQPWAGASWRAIDTLPLAEVHAAGRSAICVAITHTCRPNWKHRPVYHTQLLERALLRRAQQSAFRGSFTRTGR